MERTPCHRKKIRRWNTPGEAHELTFSCLRRRPFLLSDRFCSYFADAVNRARTKHAFDVWAYVVMPEHVHLLLWPREQEYSIPAILKAIKQSAGRRALNWLREQRPQKLPHYEVGRNDLQYAFWMDGGGYDRNVKSRDTLRQIIGYIHANPVRRGLVPHPGLWQFSSWADWHEGRSGPIPIDRESCGEAMW